MRLLLKHRASPNPRDKSRSTRYLMAMRFSSVLCIGGCVIDRYGETADRRARLHTSNVGRLRIGFGGVARNVAENLARLGVPVRLVSRVGDDADGRSVLAATEAAGVDVSGVIADRERPTASYTAVFSGEGELVIGLSDMAVLDAFSAADMRAAMATAGPDTLVFFDANLPPKAITALLAKKKGPVAAGPVSVQKCGRLRTHLRSVDHLFLNRYEARTLFFGDISLYPGKFRDLAKLMIEAHVPNGVITGGGDGAMAWSGDRTLRLDPPPASPVNVNGAGDALAAATLARLFHGDDVFTAARIAMAAAALTVESETTVRQDLTMASVLARHRTPPAATEVR